MSNKHRLTGHMINFKSITIFFDWEDHAGNEIQLDSVEPDWTNPTDEPRKRLSIDLRNTHKSTLMGLRDAISEELDTRTR
jgi:hypothetical protein